MCFILSRDPDESAPVELRILPEAVAPKIVMDVNITEDSRFVGWKWTPKIQSKIYINHLNYQKIHFVNLPPTQKNWTKKSPKNLVYQKTFTKIWIQKTQWPSNLFPGWFRWLKSWTPLGGSPWYHGVFVGLRLRYHILQRCAWKIPVDRWDCSPSTAPIIIRNLSHAFPENKVLFFRVYQPSWSQKIIPFNKAWVFLRGGG